MKNIQVIDGALNCTFSIFEATDEEFRLLFPEPRQDMQYAEDLAGQSNKQEIDAALSAIWSRPVRKQDALGIHGTLFYELQRYKEYYSEKREDAVSESAINQAQRKLFVTPLGQDRDEYGLPREPAERMQQAMLGFYDLAYEAGEVPFQAELLAELKQLRLKFMDAFEREFPGYGKGRATWR